MSAGYLRGFFLEDDALAEMTQDRRRRERLFDRDEKLLRGDPMSFRGDGELDEHGASATGLDADVGWGLQQSVRRVRARQHPSMGVCHVGCGATRTAKREG
jgi:hypothetical protein